MICMRISLLAEHFFTWFVQSRTSFDAEAKGNSGMAYQLVNTVFSRVEQIVGTLFVLEVEPEKRPLLKMAPKNK